MDAVRRRVRPTQLTLGIGVEVVEDDDEEDVRR
jgi:hypothetical protein